MTRRSGMPACWSAPTWLPRYISKVELGGKAFRKSASSRSSEMRARELIAASFKETGADQVEAELSTTKIKPAAATPSLSERRWRNSVAQYTDTAANIANAGISSNP